MLDVPTKGQTLWYSVCILLYKVSIFTVQTTEYTQSGDCRFLAHIPSWLVGVGGVHAHPLSAYYHHVKLALYAPAERAVLRQNVASHNVYVTKPNITKRKSF